MGREPNGHNLTGEIPERVKRIVRQECGFACVMCSHVGQVYDHFDPPFVDCVEHNPDGIALLCGTHDKMRLGNPPALDSARVKLARERRKLERRDPIYRPESGGSTVRLRLGEGQHSGVLVGSSVGLTIGPLQLLRIDGTDDELEPWLLSGAFSHGNGQIVRFDRNDVVACSGNWDVELTGRALVLREGRGQIVLDLAFTTTEYSVRAMNLKWPSGLRIEIDRSGGLLVADFVPPDHRMAKAVGNRGRIRIDRIDVTEDPSASRVPMVAFAGFVDGTIGSICALAPRGDVDLRAAANLASVLTPDLFALPESLP